MQLDHAPPSSRSAPSVGHRRAPAPRLVGRVLVVDDEPKLLGAYHRILRGAGYEVVAASDGLDAQAILEQERFDVIISDIRMPGLDGFELLRKAGRTHPDVPVILVTGSPSSEETDLAVAGGALLYLVKPVDARALVQIVNHASQLHRMAKLKRDALDLLEKTTPGATGRAGFEARYVQALSTLWMAYQPIVRPGDRAVFGYEALMRTRDPVLPDPGSLLDAAERLGRVQDLGRAIRAHVASNLASAPEAVQIFVNLHPRDLADPELYSASAPLSRHASRIVLEITERASLDGIDDLPRRVAALRKMGFILAIDDLGAGYAGLTAFTQLCPEVVKLDMSLVRGVEQNPVKRKIISAMLSLCKEMEILVVAEGVETRAEQAVLAELGCQLMQGYLFARPSPRFGAPTW
jgi:EAL domain-containing protein (putative c-di-GMP-specific phosphodiesterase class I)